MLQREAVAGFAMGESCGPRYDDNARLNPLSAPLRTLARRSKCGTGIGFVRSHGNRLNRLGEPGNPGVVH